MAYVKQTWQNGQIITADKLNHMEDGIEAVPEVVGDILQFSDDNNDGNIVITLDTD